MRGLSITAGVATGLWLVIASCAPQTPQQPAPRSRPIVGPDGTHMLHVSCGADEAACYEIAGRACPQGYDIGRTHGQQAGTFLVRCRAAAYGYYRQQAPQPAPAAAPQHPAAAPTTTTNAAPTTPPTGYIGSKNGIDLGY